MLTLNFDEANDILYLKRESTVNSYGDEIQSGFVVLKDISDDNVTGVTIFDFSKRYKKNLINSLPFPFKIDIKKDIIEKLNI